MAETYRSHIDITDDDFDAALSYNDMERMKEHEEVEKDESNKLSFAGMAALAAGLGLFAVNTFATLISPIADRLNFELFPLLQDFLLPAAGVAALGYGVVKMLRLVFRAKELNFPSLNVYRKKIRVASDGFNTRTAAGMSAAYDSAYDEAGRTRYDRREKNEPTRSRTFRKSRRSRVFSGVAGGIAEYTGVSAGLVRFGIIVAAASTGFFPIFFTYLLLSIVLPNSYDDYKK